MESQQVFVVHGPFDGNRLRTARVHGNYSVDLTRDVGRREMTGGVISVASVRIEIWILAPTFNEVIFTRTPELIRSPPPDNPPAITTSCTPLDLTDGLTEPTLRQCPPARTVSEATPPFHIALLRCRSRISRNE
ncbi:hypothetical protein DPEC_G00244480 [Dallia pectoralis]|uniref:Uncharacterized protein n=1 Tax=Dallia pectoralis TaxID=75939 RepID=A0ACC2FVK8_DALPE|nr:hypothetical protein DPEC_G00244480 [Dallia pectoralis]